MRQILVVILLGSVFVLAACRSSSAQPPPPSTSTPPPLPRSTATPAPTLPPTPVPLTLKRLVAVQFVDASQGWVAGGDCDGSSASRCSILATRDGGKNWTEQYHTTSALEELVFVDATHGWALGRTTGGCSGPTLACPSVLFITTDGKTWTEREIEKSGWSGLQFLTPELGWAIATNCSISGAGTRCSASLRKTGDGGATWGPVPVPGLVPTAISFVDPTYGWAVGWGCSETGAPGSCRALIMVTRDGGRNWFRQLQADDTFGTVSPRVSFVDRMNGWWISGGSTGCALGGCWPALYRTTDGGRMYIRIQRPNQWKIAGEEGRSGTPEKMQFESATSGWIAVSAGTGTGGIATTQDAGATWTRSGAGEGWEIAGISAWSARDLWAAGAQRTAQGSKALLLHSSDGGQTWAKVLPK